MRIARPPLLASVAAAAALLGCACVSSHEREARTAAAAALGCPEAQIDVKSTSDDAYYATGCSSGVDLVCSAEASNTVCKPGTPKSLTDDPSEFCRTYEVATSMPEAPSKEEYAALPHQGMLSQGLIRAQVDKHGELIQACFGCAKRRHERLSGPITVQLFVMPSGRVGGVTVTTDPLQDEALTQCVTNVVDDYEFPPPGGNGPFLTSIPLEASAP